MPPHAEPSAHALPNPSEPSGPRLNGFQFFLDVLLEPLETGPPHNDLAIDDEGRRTLDAHLFRLRDLPFYGLGMPAAFKALSEGFGGLRSGLPDLIIGTLVFIVVIRGALRILKLG